jgi:hypothetical protein
MRHKFFHIFRPALITIVFTPISMFLFSWIHERFRGRIYDLDFFGFPVPFKGWEGFGDTRWFNVWWLLIDLLFAYIVVSLVRGLCEFLCKRSKKNS